VHAAAARGTATAAGQLPHLEQIQRSFGRHDVSGVQAQPGDGASAALHDGPGGLAQDTFGPMLQLGGREFYKPLRLNA